MNLFFTLLLAHLIADFPLQVDWVYRFKRRCTLGVAFHAGIHVVVTALLIRSPLQHWPELLVLGLAHMGADWIKLRFSTTIQSPYFMMDQAIHIGILIAAAKWAGGIEGVLPPGFLYPACLYAAIPAVLMFLSVLANDLNRRKYPSGVSRPLYLRPSTISNKVINWSQQRMLVISQIVGMPLLISLPISLVLAMK